MQFSSMRARVTAIFAMLVTSLMVIGGALVLQHELKFVEDREKQTLAIAIDRAHSEIDESPQDSLLEVVRHNQGEIGAGGLVMFVTDTSDRLLWSSRKIAFPVDPVHWRTQSLTLRAQKLILASDFTPYQQRIRETAKALAAMILFMIVATSAAAWWLVGKTLSPIRKLASQANALNDTLSVRLDTPSTDAEMQHLTATLNNLLERLQRDAQSRGRFYAAASHELRTPLQALLGHLDVALSRKRTVEEYEAALLEAQQNTVRLTTLVQDLLQLNALEMGATVSPREPIELGEFVESLLLVNEKAKQERGLKIKTDLTPTEIEAPAAHLEMLLRNLLENAFKYTKVGSTVGIAVQKESNIAVFRVWNACDNLDGIKSGDDLSAWFEPFFRLDASRNSQTGGNGLGLAICASIARANGWNLALEAKEGGVLASVFFPPTLFSNPQSPSVSQQIP